VVAHRCLATAHFQAGEVDACLAALERAVAVDPHSWRQHDELFEALGEHGRHDAAERALAEAERSVGKTRYVEGRRLWLRWIRGEHDAAVAGMRELLRTEPDYVAGWRWYVEWLDRSHPDRLAALGDAPPDVLRDDPRFWGHVGDAALRAGRLREAA